MIRTVTGDIDHFDGRVLSHEHISCASDAMLRILNDRWFNQLELEKIAVAVLKRLHDEYGVGLYVDGTPCDLGRDAELLRRVSEKSGVKIVASSGLYYYPSVLTVGRTPEELAELFISECKNGMGNTDILPGILKCAVGGDKLSSDDRKRVAALGITQRECGLPLYVHSFHGGHVTEEVLELLMKFGANPEKTAVGHIVHRPDADYLAGIIERGCYICVDQCSQKRVVEVAHAVSELCKRGLDDHILCSLDQPIYSDFASSDYTGMTDSVETHLKRYAFLFETVLPEFERAGCSKEQCDAFIRKNPIKLLNIGG